MRERTTTLEKISTRNDEIYKLRENGYDYFHISNLFDLSQHRVRQIYKEVKYLKEELPKLPPFEQALSTRSKNALMGYFKDKSVFTNPEQIVIMGKNAILSIQYIGRKNIKEITQTLYKLGYIDYDDPWLDWHRDKNIAMDYISSERKKIYNLKTKCLSKWRITEMDLWDQNYIDMETEGYFSFQEDNIGDFQFGLVHGELDYRIEKSGSKERLEFSWVGQDKGSPVSGRGWAIVKRGILEGLIYFHLGDDSGFKAERVAG